MNDLITLTALPSIWNGGDVTLIGNTLLDAVDAIMNVDFLYLRLPSPQGNADLEFARLPGINNFSDAGRFGEYLYSEFDSAPPHWPRFATLQLESKSYSTVLVQLGLHSNAGILVAGTKSASFPTQQDTLILNIAANQVAMATSEAVRFLEQRNIAAELDRRVVERTAELDALNVALRKEIAERRQTEEALRNSELTSRRSAAFLTQGQRLTATGSVWWKPSTRDIFWSEEAYRIAGYPDTQRPSVELMLDRCHPDDLPRLRELVERAAQLGANVDMEHRLLMPDRSVKYVHVVLQNISKETAEPEFIGAVTDVTARKVAEERVQRSDLLLAEGQRISQTGTFSWQVDTDKLSFSSEMNRIFGFKDGTVIDFDLIAGRVYEEDLPLLAVKMADVRSGGDNPDYEIRLQVDGSIKHVRVVGRIVRHLDGSTECIGAVQDVTAQRVAEAARDKLRSELTQIARVMSLSTMAAAIAHEVNQPLSGVITNASTALRMLSATPPNIEGALETARRTIRDGNRAADVVTRLKTLFLRGISTIELFDLNNAAREVIALFANDIQRERISLRAELSEALPFIGADRVQVQQVIMNLIRNSIDAMAEISQGARDILVRTAVGSDEEVLLTVEDTGPGIASADIAWLFDPFHTTKAKGMGIGLSVSRSIVEAHGGRIWGISNPAGGATFGFSIPYRSDNTQPRRD